MNTKEQKKRIREQVWRLLEEKGVALFPPPYGRIPNFKGADRAAEVLASHPAWRNAKVVKVNPDSPQRWVRLRALREGKILIMATPRLREGFLLLDPNRIPSNLYDKASTIRGAFSLGEKVDPYSLPRIDIMVTGSVAVTRKGARLGKGEGYAELEYAILREVGALDESTPVATTVHPLQLVDDIPRDPYDVPVDIIALPSRIIETRTPYPKPKGIIWELLPEEKIREIPLLQKLRKR